MNTLFDSYGSMIRATCKVVQPDIIVEWGPGGSTAVFIECAPSARILSWDSNSSWYRKYAAEFEKYPNVEIRLGNIQAKEGFKTPYVAAPLMFLGPHSVDVLFVDGRMRSDCMVMASFLVKPSGAVILHDDNRPYNDGRKMFPYSFRHRSTITGVYSESFSVVDNIREEMGG